MTDGTLELVDLLPPTVRHAFQLTGRAANLTGGTAATVTYQVQFAEPMATDTQPRIILPNASTSAVWTWQIPANRGIFTITVPAGVDGRGMVQITSGKDTNDLVQMTPWDGPLQ